MEQSVFQVFGKVYHSVHLSYNDEFKWYCPNFHTHAFSYLQFYLQGRHKRKRRWNFGPNPTVTRRNIMKTILFMQGPVCTQRCIHNNGPGFIRHICKADFLAACTDLECEHLGELKTVNVFARTFQVFVKKSPAEISWFLEANPDFGTLEEFKDLYESPSPLCITDKLIARLVELGFLPSQDLT